MEKKAIDIAAWVGGVAFILLGIAAGYAWITLPSGVEASARPAQATTEASWYSTRECTTRANPRCLTASGEPLDDTALTCASWAYPFGTKLRVSSGSRSVVVRVNDRGPSKRLVAQGRAIDLSQAAFMKLAPLKAGVVRVSVEEVR
jgi:rare lipoprotein A